jgi:dipeptidyl aminopeptidase/acylaminoacyl peptidase
MPRFTSIILLSLVCFLTVAAGQSIVGDKIATYFRPYQTDRASLAPDGRHLAYTMRDGETAYVMIVDVDDPNSKVPVAVADDRYRLNASDREKTSASVTLLRWTSSRRLIIADDSPVVYGVDADGQNPMRLYSASDSAFKTIKPGVGDLPDNLLVFPRKFTVLPPSGADPELLVVQAHGQPSRAANIPQYLIVPTTLATIDPQNGKFRMLSEVDYSGEPFFDKQHEHEARVLLTLHDPPTFLYLPPGGSWTGRIDLDKYLGGQTAKGFLITPENYYRERSIPLGFDYNPDLLYFASNIGRDTYGIYALDLRRKTRTSLSVESPYYDLANPGSYFDESSLVFDRHQHRLVGVRFTGTGPTTVWLDQELAQLQTALNRKFPARFVEIVEWDDARTRFLLLVSGPSDPGRYVVYRRAEGRLVDFVRKAPWLDAGAVNVATGFAFDTPAGVHLTGVLTLPKTQRITPPPLLIYCHDGLTGRVSPGFNGEVQALTDMGFAVAQVNYRGSTGFGRNFRDAILAGLDKIPVEDIRATVAWIAAQHQIDRKRVALLGRGFGGFLALRAVQQFPAEFRCAITIDAPTNLADWLLVDETAANERRRQLLGADRDRLEAASPVKHVKPDDKPVFLIQNPNGTDVRRAHATAMRSALDREKVPCEYLEITDEFDRRQPGAMLEVYSAIEGFLNYYVYDWRVKIGDVKKLE